MMLSDVRDYIESLSLAEHVYSGKLDAKEEKSIGVYNSKHCHAYSTALGGRAMESYGTRYVTFLVHWSRFQRETEKAAEALFNAIRDACEAAVNGQQIKFIQPLVSGPVDVGTDGAGIYEMAIEAAVIYQRKEEGDAGNEEDGGISRI
jgi:hypothetical protein